MSLESDLRTYALADATISGLIGARWYPDKLPQNATLPAVVYQEISALPIGHAHDGASMRIAARYQITTWAATRAGAAAVDNAIRDRIDGHSGTMGSTDVGAILRRSRVAGWDYTAQDAHIATDYLVIYLEV